LAVAIDTDTQRERDERTDRAFVKAAEIEPKKVGWLWKPYLPRRVATGLGGDGGVGKSTLTTAIAAAVSTGRELPGGWLPMSGEPATVLIMNAEDDLEAVSVPRLMAADADLERVELVRLEMAEHLAVLSDQAFADMDRNMTRLAPRLVIVDPIVSFIGAERDMNRANEVRPVIRKLGGLAAKHDCAMLVVGHLNKNESASAGNRFSGTVDFRNAFRSLMLAGKVDDEPDRGCGLFHNKSNYAQVAAPLGYSFEAVDEVARTDWMANTDLTEAEVFMGKTPRTPKTKTATDIIRAVLADMPDKMAPSTYVLNVLEAALPGIAAGTVQKARDAVPVAIVRHPDGTTHWRLLDLAAEGAPVRTKPMRLPED
jgi:hypothetical protein